MSHFKEHSPSSLFILVLSSPSFFASCLPPPHVFFGRFSLLPKPFLSPPWSTVFFIHRLLYYNFLTLSIEWFLNLFFVAWQEHCLYYPISVTYPCCGHVKFSVFDTAFFFKAERDLTDTQLILQRPIISTRLFHHIYGRNRSFNDNILKMRFVRSIRTPADCSIFFVMLLLPHTGMYHSPCSSFSGLVVQTFLLPCAD